jgi:hypothetical protein
MAEKQPFEIPQQLKRLPPHRRRAVQTASAATDALYPRFEQPFVPKHGASGKAFAGS